MRMVVHFNGRSLAQALIAISPHEPLLVNEKRNFLVAMLAAEEVAQLREVGFTVTEDRVHAMG